VVDPPSLPGPGNLVQVLLERVIMLWKETVWWQASAYNIRGFCGAGHKEDDVFIVISQICNFPAAPPEIKSSLVFLGDVPGRGRARIADPKGSWGMNGWADPAESHAFPTVSPARVWVSLLSNSCGAHLGASAPCARYGAPRSWRKSNMKEELVIFFLEEAKSSWLWPALGTASVRWAEPMLPARLASELLPGGMALKIAFLSFF